MNQAPEHHPDWQLLDALTQAYRRYQQNSQRWIKGYTQSGGQIFCGAGCFHCCNLPIKVSLLEALYTASQLDGGQLKAMQSRAAEVIQNAHLSKNWNDYIQIHRAQIGFCPLLEPSTGACTAYEARPARCRDTFSAFSSHYCQVGMPENLSRAERKQYDRAVKSSAVTDGRTHYIAPLEDIGEELWNVASGEMLAAWNLEVWGDFWVLTALCQDKAFMLAVRAGMAKKAISRAKNLGLWNLKIIEINR
jgi:Fe-S-cluster containining protein